MNGLQSLMQGAPMPSQPNQAPAMPAQNDPRMAAAMQVVKDDVPEPLQGLVDESDFARKAMELLQSAGGQAAMNQPPATPPYSKATGRSASRRRCCRITGSFSSGYAAAWTASTASASPTNARRWYAFYGRS
jgi:hypothetical protein